ncbi:hypothetical protein [Micropruina sp.]|uniref:hypothetical protein n=1 Tax=Micropruina sp. TaxID=2737536 RepID=UPI0039E33782
MSDVLTGKGPQPPSVYWIRRGLVVLIAVIVLGLLVWVFTPKSQPSTTATPEVTTPSPTQTVSSPEASPSDSASVSPSPSATATAPTACDPIGVQVTLEGFKSVKSGSKQTFSVTAVNNTALPCVMEITHDTFVLRVASGSDLIWSTGHCEKWLPEVKKQTLKAGASVEFKVTWGLYRSAEDCRQAKSLLGAGTYIATALYRESATGRFVFTITK